MVEVTLKLGQDPLDTELISRQEIRDFLINAYKNNHLNKATQIKNRGRDVIKHLVMVAFLSGKQEAAQDSEIKHWCLEDNDLPILQSLRNQFISDFDKFVDDLKLQSLIPTDTSTRKKVNKFVIRAEAILQMAVWTTFNKGKRALWDDEIFQKRKELVECKQCVGAGFIIGAASLPEASNKCDLCNGKGWLEEQKYKYDNKYMVRIETDERTCPICVSIADRVGLVEHINALPDPPFHINCRCRLTAIPTVKVKDAQDRFIDQRKKGKTKYKPKRKRVKKK